jgi:Zn-finger nucleic acid-binding protein
MADAVLRCPNCGTRMVSGLRGGIPVRECGICCGVFLHRVDFERILGRRTAVPNGQRAALAYEGRHRRD